MNATPKHKLWAADPHQYGPGKIHIVDTCDERKTLCGRFVAAIPGSWFLSGRATCRICLDATVRRPEQEQQRQKYEAERMERERQRLANDQKWWDWYNQYLRSPEWNIRREKVMKRAGGICEGCLVARAVQIHHVTYKHAGNELLWELRAVCLKCHEVLHADKDVTTP